MTRRHYTIRPVRPEDVPAVVSMVHDLAEFERAPEHCHLTATQLHAALFPADAAPALFGHVAVYTDTASDSSDGEPIALALWFLNFSTWEGVHGIYLEDLYVRPEARGTGAGRRMLATLAALCVQRGYSRLDWMVLDWNPARAFYKVIGAQAKEDWVPYRLQGHSLQAVADTLS